MIRYAVADLFCGVGGLTHGFFLEGFDVVAGYDIDAACKYPYENNNPGALFIQKDIKDVTPDELSALYPPDSVKILVGCAPCQPFSKYTRKTNGVDSRWSLLDEFLRLVEGTLPDIVSMENVHGLVNYQKGRMFSAFVEKLKILGYHVFYNDSVFCPDYGIPQNRTRLVLLASRLGPLELIPKTHSPEEYTKVRDYIENTKHIEAGEFDPDDPFHRASTLSPMNLKRIKASIPGGTWYDWPDDLVANCHKKQSGKTYKNVYGRMSWDQLAPTITTQCYGYGNGRFGHPEQDRAISMREAALLQTFSAGYRFVDPEQPYHFKILARLIGNAVPVDLAKVIAKSIKRHLDAQTRSICQS
jgi:DNA (cytosine-5)-methyltransferase 1